jgi:hypothetical protein
VRKCAASLHISLVGSGTMLQDGKGVRLSPPGIVATVWRIVPAPDDDDDDCGAIRRMRIDRRNRSTRRKPAPAPLSPPQIPHVLTRA